MEDKDIIENIILEAVWIARWNKTKTSLTAVLTPEEALKITSDIIDELKNNGFEIKKIQE